MSKELAKTYDPKQIEEKLYERWCENKYFHAEVDRSKKPFTTVMPPPNITGKLHMGHALDNTLQDILIRYKRMEGYNALWIPGTDHAAISTEVKVTNQLKEEGIDKKELGREGFLERTWQWKEEYAGTIENQLKKLGISCDWDRERFTMDEGCSKAVEEVFINLYNKGYIYKGSRIINWCPKCKTSLSDAEVEHEDQDGNFWHIKYPIAGTTRRTGDTVKDRELTEALLADQKENAEHVMLVDLARNDLSRNCHDVRVLFYKEPQYYSHVIHLVSRVSGQLNEGADKIKTFIDTFPAGTLSGAPKVRAMQLISEIEPHNRGAYGGCIGFIGLNGELNQAITIRTFVSRNNELWFQAGGGIVARSQDEYELQEVNNKLGALKKAIDLAVNLKN
mgnify:CR=1 FL=1